VNAGQDDRQTDRLECGTARAASFIGARNAPILRRPIMAPRVTSILVPTDFSETGDAAVAYAKTLAGCLGASLHVLHVFADPYAAALYAPEVYAAVPEEARERALEQVRALLAQRLTAEEAIYFRGTHAIASGSAAKQIVKYAADHDIQMIVMGTHGRRGAAHVLLGSVAEQVVRTAPCPVVTVRHTAREKKPADVAAAPADCVA
jgi:nucleotide-binding universal stress UspA family protein